jgi:hypothetical protein
VACGCIVWIERTPTTYQYRQTAFVFKAIPGFYSCGEDWHSKRREKISDSGAPPNASSSSSAEDHRMPREKVCAPSGGKRFEGDLEGKHRNVKKCDFVYDSLLGFNMPFLEELDPKFMYIF